jgi:hypothetical protein
MLACPFHSSIALLQLDFKRATSTTLPETGNAILREGDFEYRLPVDRLPIDRCIERALGRDEDNHQRQAFLDHPVPQPGIYETNHQEQVFQDHPMPVYERNHQQEELQAHPLPQPEVLYFNGDAAASHPNFEHPSQARVGTSRRSRSPLSGNNDGVPENAQGYSAFAPPPPGGPGASNNEPIDLAEADEELPPERLRGGGSSPPLNYSDEPLVDETCLAAVPVDKWNYLPVYTLVATSNEGALGSDATLVGFVRPLAADLNGRIPELVEVEYYYLSNLGYFDKPKTGEFESEELLVVDVKSETEAARVINKLRAQNLGPGSNASVNPPKPSSSHCKWRGNALSFVKRLKDMKILGELPDGRQVVWISNDPAALYISVTDDKTLDESNYSLSTTISQRQYLSLIGKQEGYASASCPILKAPRPDRHFCLWGCSVTSGATGELEFSREALNFESRQELDQHHSECHKFSLETDGTELGARGRFVRVAEAQPICELNAQLSSAIIARVPTLWELAVKESLSPCTLPSGVEFAKSPSRECLVIPWCTASVETVLTTLKQAPSDLARLVHLWSRIGRLFELEGSGEFRLTQSEFQDRILSHKDFEGSAKIDGKGHSCETLATSDGFKAKRCFDCALCALPWEKAVAWCKSSENRLSPGNPSRLYRGIGCALISDVSFSRSSGDDEAAIPGLLGDAKSLLLRIVASLPDILKLAGMSTELDPLAGHRLWDKDNFTVWKAFVIDVTNPCMLAQAFTVLLASIQRVEFPRWWKSEGGGWSTAQMILASPSLPALFLHLYVFDAAVAEVVANACNKESTDTSRRKTPGSLKKRMEKYLKKADELGFPRFKGAYDTYCCFCDDGGSLLCCELCQNVQHQTCCDPPITRSDELESWICDSCINDIHAQTHESLAGA